MTARFVVTSVERSNDTCEEIFGFEIISVVTQVSKKRKNKEENQRKTSTRAKMAETQTQALNFQMFPRFSKYMHPNSKSNLGTAGIDLYHSSVHTPRSNQVKSSQVKWLSFSSFWVVALFLFFLKQLSFPPLGWCCRFPPPLGWCCRFPPPLGWCCFPSAPLADRAYGRRDEGREVLCSLLHVGVALLFPPPFFGGAAYPAPSTLPW